MPATMPYGSITVGKPTGRSWSRCAAPGSGYPRQTRSGSTTRPRPSTGVLAGELERGQALAHIPFHFVVIDWGGAWSHAGLDSPARSAEAICRLSDRVFVQVVGSPVLLTRAIRVLQQARPPRAELVLLETRRTELRRELQRTLTTHLPHLELAATGRWDHRAAVEAEDRGTTMTGHGQHLVTALQLSERAMPVLRARPPAPSPAVQ